MYYVYIIQSQLDQSFYKGFTENLKRRIEFHNEGLSKYTSTKKPWKYVAVFSFEDKSEALIKEKKLKKYNLASLMALIASSRNELKNFDFN